jgi:hypothetical protein
VKYDIIFVTRSLMKRYSFCRIIRFTGIRRPFNFAISFPTQFSRFLHFSHTISIILSATSLLERIMTKSKVRLHKSKQETRKNVANEINFLQQRIAQETPAQGYAPPITQRVAFRALPISDATLRGLEAGEFTIMTAIQNACLPHALAGRDILGAARTGRCVRYRESE